MEIHYGFLIREIDTAIKDVAEKVSGEKGSLLPGLVKANLSGQAEALLQTRGWIVRCWHSVCADPDGVAVHRFNDDGICLKCRMPRNLA